MNLNQTLFIPEDAPANQIKISVSNTSYEAMVKNTEMDYDVQTVLLINRKL